MKNESYAVVTGDVVSSSDLSKDNRESLYHSLQSIMHTVFDYYRDSIPYSPATFSGDSWQLIVSRPGEALKIALHFRALVIASSSEQKIDTRLSIGLGSIDFIPKDDISGGDGEAYRLSGQSLEQIKKQERMTVSFPDAMKSDLTEAVKLIVKMVDLQVSEWTPSQAHAVSGAMMELTQQEIAGNWPNKPISQQAVAQHLKSATWRKCP